MNNRKRVLILSHSLGGGGAEMAMINLIQETNSEFKYLHLGIFHSNLRSQTHHTSLSLNLRRSAGKFKVVVSVLRSGFRLNSLIRSFDPEITIVNCEAAELFFSLFAPRIKATVLVHVAPKGYWAKHPLLERLVRELLKMRKTKRRFVSKSLASEYGASDILVLPNIYDYSKLKSRLEIDRKVRSKNRIIFVGRLHNQKRPEQILELSSQIGVRAVFFGSGPLIDSLRKLDLELETEAIFMDFIEDVWSYTDSGDLLVLPSQYEGKPLVINEALFSGLRVLTYNHLYLKNEYKDLPVKFAESRENLFEMARELLTMEPISNFELIEIQSKLNIENMKAIRTWKHYLAESIRAIEQA